MTKAQCEKEVRESKQEEARGHQNRLRWLALEEFILFAEITDSDNDFAYFRYRRSVVRYSYETGDFKLTTGSFKMPFAPDFYSHTVGVRALDRLQQYERSKDESRIRQL